MTEPAASRFAAFAVSTPAGAIPAAVRASANLHLLDTIGCGLAAVGTGAAAHATALAVAQGGAPEAALLGAAERRPAALAALANGSRCHALDFDDTHEAGICHVSTVVAPAALAMGEATGAAGAAVLDAYLLGSEVALRVARAGAAAMYAKGFHPTGVCGAFGAAAAAARLAGLDHGRATAALGVLGSFASGLLEYLSDGSETKPLHAGWAAQAGVQAVRLAEAGASGPASVVEGRFGVLAAHGASAGAEEIAGDLGERWEIEDVSFKAYPACHFAHSSTWLAGELVREHGLSAADVAEIVVTVPAEGEPLVIEPIARKQDPQTTYEAKFSLPFTVAHLLVRGNLDVASFTQASLEDGEVRALARRVRGEPLERTPPSRFAGGTRIVTHDGAELEGFLDHVPGSPRNPLAEAQLLAKFRANAGLAIDRAVTLEDAVLAAGGPELEPLAAAFAAASPLTVGQ